MDEILEISALQVTPQKQLKIQCGVYKYFQYLPFCFFVVTSVSLLRSRLLGTEKIYNIYVYNNFSESSQHVGFWIRFVRITKKFFLNFSFFFHLFSIMHIMLMELKWTSHCISHLRLSLRCDIALWNPVSQNKTMIIIQYICHRSKSQYSLNEEWGAV